MTSDNNMRDAATAAAQRAVEHRYVDLIATLREVQRRADVTAERLAAIRRPTHE